MKQTINKSLYTKTEYSRKFNISRPTIDKLIKSGMIKTILINGSTLIKVDE